MNAWLVFFLIVFAATGPVTKIDHADEFAFVVTAGFIFSSLILGKAKITADLSKALFVLLILLTVALVQAQINQTPLWVALLGYWQIWRGHMAVLLGLLLLANRKKIPSWPIIRVLQFNLLFSLVQPFLGEAFMSLVYPVGWVEYRGGIIRTVGIFGNPNTNAFFISLYLLVKWKDYLTGLGKGLAIPWVLVCFLGLVTTGSRAALLVIPALLVVMWFKFAKYEDRRRKRNRRMARSIVLTVILGGIILLATVKNQSSDLATYSLVPDLGTLTNTTSLSEGYFRAIAAVSAFARFLSHPLLGLGYGTYGTPASFAWPSPYLEDDGLIIALDPSSDRLPLSQLDVLLPVILAESGSIGTLVWLFLIFSLFKFAKKFDAEGRTVFGLWMASLFMATLIGPGLTHPVVVAFTPFVMNWLLTNAREKARARKKAEVAVAVTNAA